MVKALNCDALSEFSWSALSVWTCQVSVADGLKLAHAQLADIARVAHLRAGQRTDLSNGVGTD